MTLSGKRILVVEDEGFVAAMIEDLLVEFGATVIGPAGSIDSALELAACAPLDAALLDINVRGRRIDPVADQLRARGIPVVFASGYGVTGAPSGAGTSVLTKPFSAETLESALSRVL
ncbi:response regulator [Alsobacter sp. R-9]